MKREILILLLMPVSLAGCIQIEAVPGRPSPGVFEAAVITPTATQPLSSATVTPHLHPPASKPIPTSTASALPPVEATPTPGYSSLDLADLTIIEPGNVAGLRPLAQLDDYPLFSPDSATIALRKEAGISLLHLQTLEEIAFLPCEQDYLCAFDYSPDGAMIAWSPQPGLVRLWDVDNQVERSQLGGFSEDCCGRIIYSPDGQLLAITDPPAVVFWDLANARERFSLENVGEVHFSPDGKTLAFPSWQEGLALTFWDIASNQPIRTLGGFETAAPVVSNLFSPDWKRVLWIARASAQLMDLATGQLGPELRLSAAQFSPDGRILAGTEHGWGDFPCTARVCLFDLDSGSLLRTLEHEGIVWNMDFSPDGRLVATADQENVKLWDVAGDSDPVSLGPGGIGQGAAFSPDGRLLAMTIEGGQTQLWGIPSQPAIPRGSPVIDSQSAARLHTLTQRSAGQPADLAFSPGGDVLALAQQDGTVQLWNLTQGMARRTLTGHTGWVYRVAFAPDGDTFASASLDGTAIVWDVSTGKELQTLRGHGGEVSSVAFAPDGSRLATASQDGSITVWGLATGQEIRTFSGHTGWVWDVAFSPDGRFLASASADRTVELWDLESGDPLFTLLGHTATVWRVSFSPDGNTLASASWDGTIKIWEVASGRELRTLTGHSDWVYGVAFSPDGRIMASASKDGEVKLWDPAGGRQLATLSGHTDRVWSVAFSPDGRLLATASDDGTVRFWAVPP